MRAIQELFAQRAALRLHALYVCRYAFYVCLGIIACGSVWNIARSLASSPRASQGRILDYYAVEGECINAHGDRSAHYKGILMHVYFDAYSPQSWHEVMGHVTQISASPLVPVMSTPPPIIPFVHLPANADGFHDSPFHAEGEGASCELQIVQRSYDPIIVTQSNR